MPDDGGPDDATVNEEAPDAAGEAQSDKDGGTPADAADVREDAKQDIARAAEAEPQRHEAQDGPKATPTQHEANAATAAGTPSPETQEAFKRKLEREQAAEDEADGGGSNESAERKHRSAKDIVADGEAPLAPLPGRVEPADDDVASPADPSDAEQAQEEQQQASAES